MAEGILKLAEEAEPLGVAVISQCDLQMEGCTAREPAAVTIVRVGTMRDQFVVCRSCLESMIREGEWSVRGSRIEPQVDFLLKDSLGRSVIGVEVKGTPRTRDVDLQRWATSLRRNLAAHSAFPNVPYFLMLLVPEKGYLWSHPDAPSDAPPDYAVDLNQLTLPGETAPTENGLAAEGWVQRSLMALLEGRLHPGGLWWTESGLQRVVDNDRLHIVQARRS
jgi:hypothetical protein